MSASENIYLKLLKFIFLAGLLVTPFVFWPESAIAFEIPKVWLVLRWLELLGIFTLVFFRETFDSKGVNGKIILLSVMFLAWSFFTAFTGTDFSKSFWGNYYRMDGIFTLIHLLVFLYFIILIFRNSWASSVIRMVSLSSLLLSIFSIIDAILIFGFNIYLSHFEDWYGAIGVFFGNPNFLAGYLLVTMAFTYHEAVRSGKRIFKIGFFLQIIAICLTRSLSGIAGLFLFAMSAFILKRNKKLLPVLLAFTIIVSFIYSLLRPYNNKLDNSKIAESRERIIMKGIIAFKEKPLLGWGWSNFDNAFKSIDYPIRYEKDVYVDKAHSHFLETLVATGFPGFIIYFLLIAQVYSLLSRSKSPQGETFLLFLVLYIFHTQTNVISISEELLFWLSAGVASKIRK